MYVLLQTIMSPLLDTLLRWRREAPVPSETLDDTVTPPSKNISKKMLNIDSSYTFQLENIDLVI